MTNGMDKQSGFTLLELIITVVLLGIVATIAVPNFTLLVRSNQVSTQTNGLLLALQQARSEALRRGTPVSVCPSTDQATCASKDDWHNGWIVFSDDNTTGTPDIDEIVRVGGGAAGPVVVTTDDDYIRFFGNGTRDTASSGEWSISWPDCTGDRARSIRLNVVGRASSAEESCT